MVKPITQSRKRSGVNITSAIDKSTSSMQRRNRKRRTNINNGTLVNIFLVFFLFSFSNFKNYYVKLKFVNNLIKIKSTIIFLLIIRHK